MKTDFLRFFKRKKGVGTNITIQIGDMKFRILSEKVEISAHEVDAIIHIVLNVLETGTNQPGYLIARRIVEEVNPSKICTAKVDGGESGIDWLIQLANHPLEFID